MVIVPAYYIALSPLSKYMYILVSSSNTIVINLNIKGHKSIRHVRCREVHPFCNVSLDVFGLSKISELQRSNFSH